MSLGLEREIIDREVYDRNAARFRAAGITLPRIGDLADPMARLAEKTASLAEVDPDAPEIGNLFRIHWHNDADRKGLAPVPEHIVLEPELTGVEAKIIVALGRPASQTLLATTMPIGRLRGQFHDFPPPALRRPELPPIKLMPTFHPAYLLRSPGETAKVEADLRMVADKLGL